MSAGAAPAPRDLVDSGQQWIGYMPVSWKLVRLGTRFVERKSMVSDADFRPLSVTKGGIVPQLETAAKTDNHDQRKLVCRSDFVINSRSDRKGSAGVSDYDGSVSTISIVLEPRAIIPRFAHYLMRSEAFQEEFYRFGTGIVADLWSTRYAAMKQITIPLPSDEEQGMIVAFLDRETSKIDALIAKQEQLIATLQEDRIATITHAVTRGLRGETLERSANLWTGMRPKSWCDTKMKYLISSVESGTSVNATDIPPGDGELGVLKTSAVSAGRFVSSASKTVIGEEILRLSCPVRAGTLLVNRANSPQFVGSAAFVADAPGNLYLSDKIWQLDLRGVEPEFIHLWTQTPTYRAQIESRIVGTSASMQNVSMTDFRELALVIPGLDEQRAIVRAVGQRTSGLERLTDKSAFSIATLREYRSALITDAVTGKIDVREMV